MNNEYPKKQPESVRPFRLWDSKKKKLIPYRAYKHQRNAHIGAMVEAYWERGKGEAIEVMDIRTWREYGQYKHASDGLKFFPPN